jgi:hypothetical protein
VATRKRQIAAGIQDAIEGMADEGYAPAQIEKELHGERYEHLPRPLPVLRTIQRIVKERQPGDSDPWFLDKSLEVDPVSAIDVLTQVIITTGGKVMALSGDEAKWITRLRDLSPDLPSWATYRLARLYITRRAEKAATGFDLDAFLAFAPWRNPQQAINYRDAIKAGRIAPPPPFLAELVPAGWVDEMIVNALDKVPSPELMQTISAALSNLPADFRGVPPPARRSVRVKHMESEQKVSHIRTEGEQ